MNGSAVEGSKIFFQLLDVGLSAFVMSFISFVPLTGDRGVVQPVARHG